MCTGVFLQLKLGFGGGVERPLGERFFAFLTRGFSVLLGVVHMKLRWRI